MVRKFSCQRRVVNQSARFSAFSYYLGRSSYIAKVSQFSKFLAISPRARSFHHRARTYVSRSSSTIAGSLRWRGINATCSGLAADEEMKKLGRGRERFNDLRAFLGREKFARATGNRGIGVKTMDDGNAKQKYRLASPISRGLGLG